eukprot:3704392-Heterocapsa_arctica.AAC.1
MNPSSLAGGGKRGGGKCKGGGGRDSGSGNPLGADGRKMKCHECESNSASRTRMSSMTWSDRRLHDRRQPYALELLDGTARWRDQPAGLLQPVPAELPRLRRAGLPRPGELRLRA